MTLPFLSNLALIALGLQPDSLLAMYKNSFTGRLYFFRCGTNHAQGSLPCAGTALPNRSANVRMKERISSLAQLSLTSCQPHGTLH